MAQTAEVAEQPSASGGDLIRPSHRIDLRVEYEEGEGDRSLKTTVRYDHPMPLGDDWRINFRIDLPYVQKWEDGENGSTLEDNGVGDFLIQGIFVRRLGEDQGFGLGTQVIVPTSLEKSKRHGRWRIRPSVGYRWPVRSISDTTFFQFVARYDYSIGSGDDPNRVRELQLSPNLEIGLPKGGYVSIFPSTDVRYNFVRHELFVPANLEVGKSWGRLVASLEGAVGVIKGDDPIYKWKFESRLGYRF